MAGAASLQRDNRGPADREANNSEMGFARKVADTVAFMDAGLIVESGPPDQLLDNPEQERTKSFFSKVL